MEEIQEQVKRNFGVSITVGISTKMESYCGFSKAYEEARTAITIGKKKETEKICFIEDLRMEEGFFEMSKMETFRNLAGKYPGILEEHDKKHGNLLYGNSSCAHRKSGGKERDGGSFVSPPEYSFLPY